MRRKKPQLCRIECTGEKNHFSSCLKKALLLGLREQGKIELHHYCRCMELLEKFDKP